jgi:hypothetical protein
LLDFVNGEETVLVTDDIPSGMLSQIRLVLGDNNTVMADSVVYDLEFHPDTAYAETTLIDVEVFAGQSTVLDTLWFK